MYCTHFAVYLEPLESETSGLDLIVIEKFRFGPFGKVLVFAVGLAARTEAVCTLSDPISVLDGRVQIRYFANVDDGTMTVEYTHSDLSWVAFGQSPGVMIDSDVVICRPGSSGALAIGKYHIESRSTDGFTPLPQTLTDASCEQANGVTTMRFTQLLAASGEISIVVDTENTFCVAFGEDNTFGYHGPNNRVIISVTILPCSNAVVSGAPTGPPVATPVAPSSKPSRVPTSSPIIPTAPPTPMGTLKTDNPTSPPTMPVETPSETLTSVPTFTPIIPTVPPTPTGPLTSDAPTPVPTTSMSVETSRPTGRNIKGVPTEIPTEAPLETSWPTRSIKGALEGGVVLTGARYIVSGVTAGKSSSKRKGTKTSHKTDKSQSSRSLRSMF